MATVEANLGVCSACHLYGQRVLRRKGMNNWHKCEYNSMSISNILTLPM